MIVDHNNNDNNDDDRHNHELSPLLLWRPFLPSSLCTLANSL
jgi:hypothetical protein